MTLRSAPERDSDAIDADTSVLGELVDALAVRTGWGYRLRMDTAGRLTTPLTVPNRPGLPRAPLIAHVCGPSLPHDAHPPCSRVPVLVLAVAVLGARCAWPARRMTCDGHPPASVIRSSARPTSPERGRSVAVRYALDAVGVAVSLGRRVARDVASTAPGLVRWAYGRVGVDLPHSSYALYGHGAPGAASRAWPRATSSSSRGLGHVGLYVGTRTDGARAPDRTKRRRSSRLGSTNYGSRLIGARRVAA